MDVSSDSKHFPKEKNQNHQACFPLVWQPFLRPHFHSSMSSFLTFFELKKAAGLRQEPMKSHTPSRSIQAMIPEKSPFEELIGVWTYFISIYTITGKSASCQAEQQCQRDAAETPLEELSTKQIKTNVCDKHQPFVKSAQFKDHIFSWPRLQFLFVLSHHCFETWLDAINRPSKCSRTTLRGITGAITISSERYGIYWWEINIGHNAIDFFPCSFIFKFLQCFVACSGLSGFFLF